MEVAKEHKPHHRTFNVVVIMATSKEVTTRPDQLIAELKCAAMTAFGIPAAQAVEYRLAQRPGDPNALLNDGKRVEDYHLHPGSKLFLVKPHNDA